MRDAQQPLRQAVISVLHGDMMSGEDQTALGSRLRSARLALGLTQKEFAASLGIVQGFLSGIECGKKQPSDTLLIALTHFYRIRAEWLKHGSGPMFAEDAPQAPVQGKAPLLRTVPSHFPEQAVQTTEFVSLPNLPPSCYATVCYGDFMAPTIRDGDLIIFTTEGGKKSGDIILVTNRWGETILRRYRLRGDQVYLAADNPSYAPFIPDKETRTIGKVVEVWRKVRI